MNEWFFCYINTHLYTNAYKKYMFMVAFILVYKFMIQSTYYFFFISILILILIRKEHFYSIFFFVDRMNSVLNSRRMHNSLKPRFNVLKKLALLLLFFRNWFLYYVLQMHNSSILVENSCIHLCLITKSIWVIELENANALNTIHFSLIYLTEIKVFFV